MKKHVALIRHMSLREVNKWLTNCDIAVGANENDAENECELQPHDSRSNVGTNTTSRKSSSHGSNHSSKSARSSADSSKRIQAEAEEAALEARAVCVCVCVCCTMFTWTENTPLSRRSYSRFILFCVEHNSVAE